MRIGDCKKVVNMIEKNGKFIIIGSFVLRIKDVQTIISANEDGKLFIKIIMRGSNQLYYTPCTDEEQRRAYLDKILYLLNDD